MNEGEECSGKRERGQSMSRRVEREYETALERTPKRWRRMRDLAHEGWGMTDQMKARRYKDKFSSYVSHSHKIYKN